MLVWLKENHPQLLERAHRLFISSLINHRLTGEFTTDITMAGTSQMLDIQQTRFQSANFTATGIPSRRLFPRLVEAGEQIGTLQNSAAAMLGLPVGIPVISAGHDTQFALLALVPNKMNPCSLPVHGNFNGPQRPVDTSLLSQYAGSTLRTG